MKALLIGVPSMPILAGLAVLFLGRRFTRVASWVPVAGSGISFLLLIVLWARETSVDALWMQSGGFQLTVGLELNPLSYFFGLLVAFIALLVDIYSIGYMAGEANQRRFFATFSFFAAAMLTLVLADSFLLLFAAWEGVGVASFLLIGFWFEREEARRAAQKAFLLTRLGDLGFLLAWLLVMLLVGSTQIDVFLQVVQSGVFGVGTLTLLALLFLSGAIGKSAQLPLTAWLPAAMAGPTPVSALIHSATMVAAGVYLILRLFPLFSAAPGALGVLLWVGALTSLLASLVATVQMDLKRVLAWSTASQLGEMMIALGLAGPLAAAFQLATHAAIKATLFLSAGAVDRATGTRDLRRLGRLARKMPLTTLVFGLAAVSLVGMPPFSGFWSEEAILGQAAAVGGGLAIFILALNFLAGSYISRATTATFAGWPGSPEPDARDPEWRMKVGMSALGLAAALLGWILLSQIMAWLFLPRFAAPVLLLRLSAVVAAIAGLAFGSWRVLQQGPEPALGRLPCLLEDGLEAVTDAPVRQILAISRYIETLERCLDGVTQALVELFVQVALRTSSIENGFDRLGFGLSKAILSLAAGTESTEEQGFSNSLDRFAALFSRGGQWLRKLQTGRIYSYILGIIAWVLLAELLVTLYRFGLP